MSDIQDVIVLITDKLRALEGVQSAPNVIPDSHGSNCFFVVWPGPSSIEHGTAGGMKYLESVIVELHVTRGNSMTAAYERAIRYVQTVPHAIFDVLVDNTIAFSNISSSGLIPLAWGETQTIGYRWTVNNIKTMLDI